MAPVKNVGLLKWLRTIVVEKIPKIMPIESCKNQDLITRRDRFTRFDEINPFRGNARSFAYGEDAQ